MIHNTVNKMEAGKIIDRLRSMSSEENIKGMARFGIVADEVLGISMPDLNKIAKEIGTDHRLAIELWKTGIHDVRILCGLIADKQLVTEDLMEDWVKDFDNWAVCDQICSKLFDRTPFGWSKAAEWCHREEEFVRRAGFVLMAALSVHDKKADVCRFEEFLPYIIKYSTDERNFVKKAVNWALRQIGKRSRYLHEIAINTGERIIEVHGQSKSARWIARDALRELRDEKTIARIKK